MRRPHISALHLSEDPAPIVRRWRDAVARLEVASNLAAEIELPEITAALDAADAEATAAFAALVSAGGLHWRLLQAYADALEWVMAEYGALSDNPHQAALGHSIVAKPRALADDRQ